MKIERGQIRGAHFHFFVVKIALFCIFRKLPSVSKTTPGRISNILLETDIFLSS